MSRATPSPPRRMVEPPRWRVLCVVALTLAIVAPIFALARHTRAAPFAGFGVLAVAVGAPFAALLLGSIGEWLVHRYLMHRRWRWPLLTAIFELHHRGHHHIHFTPDRYVHAGAINYIPVYPPRPAELCTSGTSRALSMLAQLGLYLVIALVGVGAPTALVTRNTAFTAVLGAGTLVLCYLFVRVHDVVHYPGQRWMERRALFRFLDRHHYIHHIDTAANTNFLLPLGDLLFGTLRQELTPAELARWPSYEAARERLVNESEVDARVVMLADQATGS